MGSYLRKTRLTAPVQRPNTVLRPRLLQLLEKILDRDTTCKLVFSNGEEVELTLIDVRGVQLIPLARAPGPPIKTDSVRLVIESVYPGSFYDDTCLGEFEVWGIVR